MPSTICRQWLAPTLIIACMTAASHAVVVSADTNGGYGAQVMDIILANWTRPAGAKGSTSVLVRITNDGRPFSCELRKGSGNPAVDDAICMAVAKAGMFPPAPYAAPAEVALTFIYDDTAPAPAPAAPATPKTYADTLIENTRPHIVLPADLKGEFSAVLRLTVLPDGSLAEYKMEKSSGSPALDAAILRALFQPGSITPPPDNKQQDVTLTFSVNAN